MLQEFLIYVLFVAIFSRRIDKKQLTGFLLRVAVFGGEATYLHNISIFVQQKMLSIESFCIAFHVD